MVAKLVPNWFLLSYSWSRKSSYLGGVGIDEVLGINHSAATCWEKTGKQSRQRLCLYQSPGLGGRFLQRQFLNTIAVIIWRKSKEREREREVLVGNGVERGHNDYSPPQP